MNKWIGMGRLTRDPEISYAQNENNTCIARYSLAVDRRYKQEGGQEADFPSCVVFGKGAEFAEKYLHKGMKILVTGRLETGSYTNREGVKVYTTNVVVEEQEFAESKSASQRIIEENKQKQAKDGSYVPEGFEEIEDDEENGLPF